MEESVEGFIQQYKTYAASVEVLPKTEGSPLLEVVANQRVLHLLERTAPYQSKPGKARVIVNPMTLALEKSSEMVKVLPFLRSATCECKVWFSSCSQALPSLMRVCPWS
jgi:hypothetical protein